MKKGILILMILTLLPAMAGCGEVHMAETEGSPVVSEIAADTTPRGGPAAIPHPAETEAPVQTEETTPPQTLPPPEPLPMQEVPYTIALAGSVPIYSAPDGTGTYVRDVGNDGIYTIVEEAYDYRDDLWGKLKSGIGWVNLARIHRETSLDALLQADCGMEDPVLAQPHHSFSDGKEYRIPIVFRTPVKLTDLVLFEVLYNADGPYPGGDLYTLAELTAEMPLVAELSFPGDMTMYGIRFTAEDGTRHTCTLYMSGMDGSLILQAGF